MKYHLSENIYLQTITTTTTTTTTIHFTHGSTIRFNTNTIVSGMYFSVIVTEAPSIVIVGTSVSASVISGWWLVASGSYFAHTASYTYIYFLHTLYPRFI